MRQILLVIIVVILAGFALSNIADSSTSVATIHNDEVTTSQTEASNSSASATITITMYTLPTE